MKILVFNWRDIENPEAGGAEVQLHEIFKRLSQRGHKVVLLSSRYNGCTKTENIDGVEVIRVGNKFTFNLSVLLYYLLKLRKEKFDIAVDGFSKIPFYTPLFVKKPLIAIIYHIHGKTLFKELPFPVALFIYFSEKLMPLFYKKTLFVTISESTKEELIQMAIPKENIRIVFNAIDHKLYTPGTKSKEPLVIYVGRVKKYKQLNHLIRAFKLLEEKTSTAQLIIAGKGDGYRELKELAKKLALKSARFYGEITDEEKVKIMQKGWIFVTPSMKEGWGISVLEANACGTPAIAYDVPGLRDSIKNKKTGLLVESGNIKALEEAITMTLSDVKLRIELSKNALEYSRQFSWDESAEEIERIIKGVVKGSKAI